MAKKVKLLVDAHLFDGMFQGSRTFLKGLYAKLSESDQLDITLAAYNMENLEREFSDISCSINFIKLKSPSKFRRLLVDFPAMIEKHKFDYAHFQYIDPPIKLCRTIITIHDVLFLEFPEDFSWAYRQKKHLFKFAGSRADILTTDSQYSRHAINRYLNIPLENIQVVRPALESSFFELPSINALQSSKLKVHEAFGFDKYLLYVSRIEPRKNHDILLKAFLDLELWKQGFHLVFVGKTSIENPRLNYLYRSMGQKILEFVHHHESVSHQLLLDLFRASTLFVYPTRAEGFGYPPLEAGVLGVETLTSDATCLSEFDFFGDRFFSPDDLDSLKNKMSAIIEGRFDGPSMSDISETIRNNFGWLNTATVMEKLICSDFFSSK
jgi:glycosyltransferase involved in cell wall biosynthesis